MTNRFRQQRAARSLQRGFLLNPFRFGVPGADPYYAFVSSLLHFDGANGSTTFTDEKSLTWTPTGNAQISTAQSKFGGASGLFDGTGDWIQTASSSVLDLGTGNFTIEAWIRLTAQTNNFMGILASNEATFLSTSRFFCCYGASAPAPGQQRRVALGGSGIGVGNAVVLSTTQLNLNQWYHAAVTRTGTTTRLFLDGVLESTATSSDSFNFSTNGTLIGANGWDGGAGHYQGYIDDLRVTKGICRYTANFTPPTAAFPNF